MMGDTSSFAFTISLAAVINGLGIVRLLSSAADYLRSWRKVQVTHFWVYNLLWLFQFLIHVLLWWSLWGVRGIGTFNFLSYLYLLAGPILLFLATSVLLPDTEDGSVDIRAQYPVLARPYFAVLALAWAWAIALWPILLGVLSPTAPILGVFLAAALVLVRSTSERLHAVFVVGHYVLLVLLIGLFGLEVGGVGRRILEGQ
jgi:hypothetical protein